MKRLAIALSILRHVFVVEIIFPIRWQVFLFIRHFVKSPKYISQLPSPPIVISMTSYTQRFTFTRKSIKSLIMQNHSFSKIVLFLESRDFSSKATFDDLLKFNLEIREYKSNYRSYLKLIPALELYTNDLIVTADDDMYYNKNWLKELMSCHNQYPMDICGHRGVIATKLNSSEYTPYQTWKVVDVAGCQVNLFLTSSAGILYPPNIFDGTILDMELAMKLSPTNDDIWVYFNALKCQISSRLVSSTNRDPYYWIGSQTSALRHENVTEKLNDAIMNSMQKYFEQFLVIEEHNE
jgi:hypothetical protein